MVEERPSVSVAVTVLLSEGYPTVGVVSGADSDEVGSRDTVRVWLSDREPPESDSEKVGEAVRVTEPTDDVRDIDSGAVMERDLLLAKVKVPNENDC